MYFDYLNLLYQGRIEEAYDIWLKLEYRIVVEDICDWESFFLMTPESRVFTPKELRDAIREAEAWVMASFDYRKKLWQLRLQRLNEL